jgi:putative transposase
LPWSGWQNRTAWGYRRIQGALFNLRHDLARSTIGAIFSGTASNRHQNADGRQPGRVSHAALAADFFTTEQPTRLAAVILFFIELSMGKVEIAGVAKANGLWMSQIGRNLTDSVDGLLKRKRYLIHDRDPCC